MTINKRYWLGLPTGRAGMQRLFSVGAGTSAPVSRNDRVSKLLSGGSNNVRSPVPKRNWTFSRAWLTASEADLLNGFYEGLIDPAPLRLLDPNDRNLLGPDASTFGGYRADNSFWVPSSLAYSYDSTTPGPAGGVLSSDALYLPTPGAGQFISSLTSDATVRIPRIPGVNYDFSIWAIKGPTGTLSMQCSLIGTNTVVGASTPITPAWGRVSVNASDAALGAMTPYIDMRISVSVSGSSPVASIRAPQLSISDSTLDYVSGFGVANVIFAAELSRGTPRLNFRDVSWKLAEI